MKCVNKIKILFICPGGQTNLNSPSENLAKYINENYDNIEINIFNQSFRPIKNNANANGYDLVWGDMDGLNVPSIALSLAKQANIPCYIHGEWVPPYRFENGWSEYFNEPTNLGYRGKYMQNLKAMQDADIVSLALSSTPGGFDWIKEKTNIDFTNKFVRYPACKKYELIETPKKNQVATIARVNDGKKRVKKTVDAISKTKTKPKFLVIGGNISHPNVNIEALGSFNNDNKVKVYAESKLAIQHWSGIPPAEAIQQLCPVLSFDTPYMRELYDDGVIWVKKDDIDDLANKIDYWLTNDKEREDFAKYVRNKFVRGEYNVKLEESRADLVVRNILNTLK